MWGLQTVATFHRYSRTHRVGLQGLVLTYRVYPNLKSVQFRKAKEFMRVKFPVLQKYVKNLRFISHFHFHFHSHSHSHFPFRHRPFLVRRSPPPVILLSHAEPLSVPIRRCPRPSVSVCFRPLPSAVIRRHPPPFVSARFRPLLAAPDCFRLLPSASTAVIRFRPLLSASVRFCPPTCRGAPRPLSRVPPAASTLRCRFRGSATT